MSRDAHKNEDEHKAGNGTNTHVVVDVAVGGYNGGLARSMAELSDVGNPVLQGWGREKGGRKEVQRKGARAGESQRRSIQHATHTVCNVYRGMY